MKQQQHSRLLRKLMSVLLLEHLDLRQQPGLALSTSSCQRLRQKPVPRLWQPPCWKGAPRAGNVTPQWEGNGGRERSCARRDSGEPVCK